MPQEYFESDDHALQAGMFIGHLMSKGVNVIPELDDKGNYTGVLQIRMNIPLDPTVITTFVKVLPPSQT